MYRLSVLWSHNVEGNIEKLTSLYFERYHLSNSTGRPSCSGANHCLSLCHANPSLASPSCNIFFKYARCCVLSRNAFHSVRDTGITFSPIFLSKLCLKFVVPRANPGLFLKKWVGPSTSIAVFSSGTSKSTGIPYFIHSGSLLYPIVSRQRARSFWAPETCNQYWTSGQESSSNKQDKCTIGWSSWVQQADVMKLFWSRLWQIEYPWHYMQVKKSYP